MSEEIRTAILKFGGSSVADADRMREVALIIKNYIERGYSVAAIVSAMGNTTNELLALAGDVTDE
ncbi:MAG: aspartate kinase, partial [Synergistaceae bacterium]|nr:aspartate kinase [Synergistaceae bacterium]